MATGDDVDVGEKTATPARGMALARTMSWPHLVAMGVGAIVGTGILTLIGVGADKAGRGDCGCDGRPRWLAIARRADRARSSPTVGRPRPGSPPVEGYRVRA